VAHGRRPALTARHPLHVTIRFAAGLPSLREPVLLARVRDALRSGKERFGLRVCHYSVQGNHMHMIVEATSRRALSLGMRGLGVRIARGVNRTLGRTGRVIGDRYHARALETPRATRNALVYVLLNSARHGGKSVRLDPASSGAVFDGWRTPPLPHGISPPPHLADTVVAPDLWLLRTAWRRGGLIDPRAVPGHAHGRSSTDPGSGPSRAGDRRGTAGPSRG
jgi:REP element-mobilizing transposase RayT